MTFLYFCNKIFIYFYNFIPTIINKNLIKNMYAFYINYKYYISSGELLYVNFYQTSRQYKSFNFVFRQLINIHRQQRKLKQFNINHEISCKI